MGRITNLTARDMTMTTNINHLAVISSAAVGSHAARIGIKRIEISQRTSTTLGMVSGALSRRTGGAVTATATTPANLRPLGGPASGLTGNVAPVGGAGRSGTASTVDTTPAYTNHHFFEFANLNGYLWKPDPEEEIEIPASTIWVVRFMADPATLTGWTISVILDEK
jgi:hypothetical protein